VILAVAGSGCLVPPPTAQQVVPGAQPSLTPDDTVPYGGHSDPADPRWIDVYQPGPGAPPPPAGGRPLIVYVHGGAWMLPGRGTIACGGQPPCNLATGLPALGLQVARGYVLASVGYPLLTSTTNQHPTQVRSVKLAIDALVDDAADLGIDPDRIVVAGHSAGGHLAAMVALTPGQYEPAGVAATDVAGFVLLNGPTDLVRWADWGDADPSRPAWIADASDAMAGCDHTAPACEAPGGPMDQASPLHHASAGDPPGYLTCTTWDPYVPCEQLDALHDRLVDVQGDDAAAVFDRIACDGPDAAARPVPCTLDTAEVIERHNPDFDLHLAALQTWLDQVT
jgi:acetyl esterase/lipase